MPKQTQATGIETSDDADIPDFSDLNEKEQADLITLTDGIAEAALTGVLAASGSSLEQQNAAVRTVWFKIIPEYFQARDEFFRALFNPQDYEANEIE